MARFILIAALIILNCFATKAQTISVAEKRIITSFENLNFYHSSKDTYQNRRKLNNEIRINLLNYLKIHKLSIDFLHQLEAKKVKVTYSADSRMTIISWSTDKTDYTGLFTSLIQYSYGNVVFAAVIFDATNSTTDNPGQQYTKIYTLVSKASGVLYLAKYNEIYSNVGCGQGIKAFRFYKAGIENVNVFKNNDKLSCDLNIGYNSFAYLGLGSPQITFDVLHNTLYVPKISFSGDIKKGYDRCQFNGKIFIKL